MHTENLDLLQRKMKGQLKKIYLQELLPPEEYEKLKQDEIILGFTLDNKCDLDTFVGDAKSCVYHGDEQAIHSLVTGEFTKDDVYVKGK